jgi:cytochrome c553
MMDERGHNRMGRGRGARLLTLLVVALPLAVAGCTRDGEFQAISMWNESRLKPMEESPLPSEASSARMIPAGTVARGEPSWDDPVASGRRAGRLVTASPIPVTQVMLARGQERYNVYCAPCHGRLGDGAGLIVKRGFPAPPDYTIRRLRDAPLGHYFDVITNGYGIMYPYADRVPVADRWAIASYIRVLQRTRPEVPRETGIEERRRARALVSPPSANRPRVSQPSRGAEVDPRITDTQYGP